MYVLQYGNDIGAGHSQVIIDVGIRVLWCIGRLEETADDDVNVSLVDDAVLIHVSNERRRSRGGRVGRRD